MKIQLVSELLRQQKESRKARKLADELKAREECELILKEEKAISKVRDGLISRGLLISYVSYIEAPIAEPFLEHRGCTKYERVSKWFGAEAMCFIEDRHAILGFAGTNSIIDIFVDLVGSVPWRIPAFHSGFVGSWRALKRKRILKWLQENESRFDSISLYGHSLGGAIANVAAFDLVTHYKIREVVTLGAPRAAFLGTGTKYDDAQIIDSQNTLKDVSYRVVHGFDLVAKVPLAIMGYRHVGQLVYQDYRGNTHFEGLAEKHKRDETLFKLARTWFRNQRFNELIKPVSPYRFGQASNERLLVGKTVHWGAKDTFQKTKPSISHPVFGNSYRGTTSLYSANDLSHLSALDKVKSFAELGGNVLPQFKAAGLGLVACFVPLVVFLVSVMYIFVGGKSHPIKGYFRTYTFDGIKSELASPKPTRLLDRAVKTIKGAIAKTVKILLILSAVSLVAYAVVLIVQHTLIPGFKMIFASLGF